MENKNFENDLNELIRTSMEIEDKPSFELNSRLKLRFIKKKPLWRESKLIPFPFGLFL